MSKFAESVLQLSKTLVAQYDTIFDHRGNRGDSRESAVIQYLEKIFPRGFGFAKGEMFDSTGAVSGEVDIVIYDTVYSTVFHDGSGKILAPVESCYGAIECKSTLTTSELDDCIRKINKYRTMQRPEANTGQVFITPDFSLTGGQGILLKRTDNRPTFGIFAFECSISLDTLLNKMRFNNQIDYIIVPGKFCFIGYNYFSMDGRPIVNFTVEGERSVAVWVLGLQILLRPIRLIGANKEAILTQIIRESQIGSLPGL
ncbi:MAG TPA: DUF6602 domain-containing protein [Beijerinckiaceae bacterium]|jgi:hypothetical protein